MNREKCLQTRGIVACILISLSSLSLAQEVAKGIIKGRLERFKENKEPLKSMKRTRTKDPVIIAQKASDVEK